MSSKKNFCDPRHVCARITGDGEQDAEKHQIIQKSDYQNYNLYFPLERR